MLFLQKLQNICVQNTPPTNGRTAYKLQGRKFYTDVTQEYISDILLHKVAKRDCKRCNHRVVDKFVPVLLVPWSLPLVSSTGYGMYNHRASHSFNRIHVSPCIAYNILKKNIIIHTRLNSNTSFIKFPTATSS